MNDNQDLNVQRSSANQLSGLGSQGQTWKFVQEATTFARPASLFDRPLEITIKMLRGLRMVDETIVVHGDVNTPDTNKEEQL